MKKLLTTVAAFASLGFVNAASAADMPVKAPMMAAPTYNWTGFYIGAEGGVRITHSNWNANCFQGGLGVGTCISPPAVGAANSQSLNDSGAQLGGFAGYNWQFMQLGLLGVESDINWGHTKGSLAGGFPGLLLPISTSINDSGFVSTGWGGSIRARAGFFPVSSLLVYSTGGVAFQQFSFNASCPSELGVWCNFAHDEAVSTIRTGYTVGVGVEKAFGGTAGMIGNGPWHMRLEYRYSNFGSFSHNFFANTIDVIGVNFPLQTQTIQFGISYNF
jgi:outer membrane immunogenic protein